MKHLMAGLMSSAVFISSSAFAGPGLPPAIDDNPPVAAPSTDKTGLIRQNYITSSGATVPRPGLLQGRSASPPDDHSIERLNDRIDNSICKGC